jgi:hypothetical protein
MEHFEDVVLEKTADVVLTPEALKLKMPFCMLYRII